MANCVIVIWSRRIFMSDVNEKIRIVTTGYLALCSFKFYLIVSFERNCQTAFNCRNCGNKIACYFWNQKFILNVFV